VKTCISVEDRLSGAAAPGQYMVSIGLLLREALDTKTNVRLNMYLASGVFPLDQIADVEVGPSINLKLKLFAKYSCDDDT